MESNWRWNVFEQGLSQGAIELFACMLPPNDGWVSREPFDELYWVQRYWRAHPDGTWFEFNSPDFIRTNRPFPDNRLVEPD